MATARPFAYNPGTSIPGTEQVGSLSVGSPTSGFTNNPQFWNGPDEDLGYVIAAPVSGNTQPTEIPGVFASVGFYQTSDFSDSDFINLSQSVSSTYGTPQTFSSATDASTWLTTNGFWNSYVASLCDSFTFTGNNATTTSSSAINDGTSGWDSSAYSLETFTGPVSVTFQTSANGNILMGGFSYNPTANLGDTYVDTSYGIYTYGGTQIEIYENGGQAAVIDLGSTVSSSDVWKVDYDGTSVKYYCNSTLLYTSTNAVTQPLHVFFPLFTPNEGAVDICVIGTLSPIPTPTQTPTNTQTPTPTPTPTSGVTVDRWFFYGTEGSSPSSPTNPGNALFMDVNGKTTYNPNKVDGYIQIYFNRYDDNGTDYGTQFNNLKTLGGSISITQNGQTATYTSTSPNQFNYNNSPNGFLQIPGTVNQTASTASPFVYGSPITLTFI